MVEMLVNNRKVEKRGDKFVFSLHQEQEYPAEARASMLENWAKELKTKQEWIDKFEEHKALAIKTTSVQLETFKEKLLEDIENIKKGMTLWESVK